MEAAPLVVGLLRGAVDRMFQATFLGHHCWLFSTGQTCVVVDPLLHDRFGFTDAIELHVHPPRLLDFARFPAIDAILLTHEHEGHFDIASLNLFDRRIPVYLSQRSSLATRWILEEMGFRVRLVYPGTTVAIGDIEVFPMTGDQNTQIIEEWDVFAYLITDVARHGSFFTHSDVMPTDDMVASARKAVDRPCLWAYTNNHFDLHFQESWRGPNFDYARTYVDLVATFHRKVEDEWAPAQAVLVIGGGFAFAGQQAWLNRNAFLFDVFRAATALACELPASDVLAPVPGQVFSMRHGELIDREAQAQYAAVPPPPAWEPRDFVGDVEWLVGYAPACGKSDFPEAGISQLQRELDGFASYLYGRQPFRALYSLSAAAVAGRKPTFAISLLADRDGGAFVFEYSPQSCEFVPVECADPVAEYLAVYECWATDMLALFRCEISANALSFGRSRSWNVNGESFFFDVNHHIFEYVHPLRQPERALELYRSVLAVQPFIRRGRVIEATMSCLRATHEPTGVRENRPDTRQAYGS